jgi:serine/threonine protein kinase
MPAPSFKTKNTSSVPKQIQLAHLEQNGKLYSDEMVERIKGLDLPEGRTRKVDLLKLLQQKFPEQTYKPEDVNFSIERHGDNFNAIYKGRSSRDFFVLENIPDINLEKYTNSYVFTLDPPSLNYVDSDSKLQHLSIEDTAKFDLLLQDFNEDFIAKDQPLRKQLAESQLILQDIIDLVGANPGHERIKAGDFSLGAGAFGSVKLTQDLTSGEWNVIKVIKGNDNQEGLNAETQNLQRVGQLAAVYQRSNKHEEIQNEIIMKRAKGVEIFKMAYAGMQLPTSGWVDISINMLKALEDIQKSGILHRDIKCENMLCDPITKEVTLVDFGLAVTTDNVTVGIKDNTQGAVGTFVAPESASDLIYNEKTEVYAMGIAIANMFNLTQNKLYPGLAERDHPNFTDNSKIPDPVAREAILTQLEKMTAFDPSQRPTVAEAMQSLKEIREKLLDTQALTVQATFLDVNQFEKVNGEEKSAIIAKLLDSNEVWLIDKNADNHNLMYYENIKRELAGRGINVSEEVIQPLTSQLPQVMQDYAKQRQETYHQIFEYSNATPELEAVVQQTSRRSSTSGIFSNLSSSIKQEIQDPALTTLMTAGVSKEQIQQEVAGNSSYKAPVSESRPADTKQEAAVNTKHYVPPMRT